MCSQQCILSVCVMTASIHFDHAVNLCDEPEAREETYRAWKPQIDNSFKKLKYMPS